MRTYVIFFMLLLFVGYSAFAQTLASFDKWIDYPVSSTYLKKAISAETYHGTNTWVAIQIDTSASKKYQQLLRLDTDGNLLFAKQHYTRGYIYNIKATPDDGCLLIGVTAQGSYWVGWVARCDKFGEIQWSYAYGEPNINIYLEQAVLAKNGNYVVAGWCYLSGSKYGIVAMEIDTLGNIQWTGKYDETLGSRRLISRIMVLDDGSYLLGTHYVDNPCMSRLIRLKSNGELWYHNTYWMGNLYCFDFYGISDFVPIQNNQKHFYFLISFFLYPSILAETDSMGVIINKKNLPVYGRPKFLTFMNNKMFLTEQKDVGTYEESVNYLIDTTTLETKFAYYPRNSYFTKASYKPSGANIMLTYLDINASKILLYKRTEQDFSVKFCKDTLITMTGLNMYLKDTLISMTTSKPTYTRQFLSHSSQNISVTIHTECSKATSIEENLFSTTQQGTLVYPNPAYTHIYIKLPEQNTDIRIWDMYGKLVYERKNVNTLHQVSVEHFSQGLYNVEIQTNHQKQFQKFLKID